MAEYLSIRTAQRDIERAVVNALSYGVKERLTVVATVSALQALVSDQQADKSLRYVTAASLCYEWNRFSTTAHDGAATVRPNDRTASQPGRWLRTTSAVTSGYAKEVRMYQGPATISSILERNAGRVPALLVMWTGGTHRAAGPRPGGIYWYHCTFDVLAVSKCPRPDYASMEGSPVSSESDDDPGTIAMIGDVKVLLPGTDLGIDGISRVEIGDEDMVLEDLEGRTFIQKISIDVLASVQRTDQDSSAVELTEIALQGALADTGFEEDFDDENYVVSGYAVALGAGLTKAPSTGSAYLAGTLVTSTPVANVFTASKDTYRDLNSDGSFTYIETDHDGEPAEPASNRLRVGVTRTDASGVIFDRYVGSVAIEFGPEDIVSMEE